MSSRHDGDRLGDILDAIVAIRSHMTRGDLADGLVFDAVRVRLIEIGEAVKALDPNLLAQEPEIAWNDAAGMRDWLAHHYFDTAPARIEITIVEDLPPLEAAVRRLQSHRALAEERLGDGTGRGHQNDLGPGQ